MANYSCTVRTNYFHVKDEEAFRSLMSRVYGREDAVELWEDKDKDGKTVFGFGALGGIAGVFDSKEDDTDDDTAYDEFICGLRKCVADDDAIIILESGNEKLNYVIGNARIITGSDFEYLNITALAIEKAKEMLGKPNWNTKCEY